MRCAGVYQYLKRLCSRKGIQIGEFESCLVVVSEKKVLIFVSTATGQPQSEILKHV